MWSRKYTNQEKINQCNRQIERRSLKIAALKAEIEFLYEKRLDLEQNDRSV